MADRDFCVNCKDDSFPVAVEPTAWRMGQMRPLNKAPAKVKRQFRSWEEGDIVERPMLCGNCYFDLTDPVSTKLSAPPERIWLTDFTDDFGGRLPSWTTEKEQAISCPDDEYGAVEYILKRDHADCVPASKVRELAAEWQAIPKEGFSGWTANACAKQLLALLPSPT